MSDPMLSANTDPHAELAAMRKIVAALDPFDPETKFRIIAWAYDRFSIDELKALPLYRPGQAEQTIGDGAHP